MRENEKMPMPMLYSELTPEERAWMCNGCGPKFGSSAVPDCIFEPACDRHDFDYWLGYTDSDRYQADVFFRSNMLHIVSSLSSLRARVFYTLLAWFYYAMVRFFGAKVFTYRERYATREDLVCEMLEDP
jgi:hypothetical protein